MDEIESMAVREPLWARTLMLDTLQREDQMREDIANAIFGTAPKVRLFITWLVNCIRVVSYLRF